MRHSTTSETARHQSIWAATAKMPTYPALTQNLEADVCVVGAGIAGLSTAYLLGQAGKSVVVLDDGPLAGGMTQVTTAHLSNAIDDRYYEIERLHGDDGLRLAAESHTAAIDRIETIVGTERIDCEFERVDGFLFLRPGEDKDVLDRELASARKAGLTRVEKRPRAPLDRFDTGPCLRFPDQGQFHPLKYLSGVAKAIERDGGRLFTKSHVDEVEAGPPCRVTVGSHRVSADAVVVATNSPILSGLQIHTQQAPYLTYVIGAGIPRGSVPRALFWDTEHPYHYIRLESGEEHDLLIVGGEDHKTGQAEDAAERHGRLEAWARERFPMMEEIEYLWGGQVLETVDGLAFIGRNPGEEGNLFIVTGDSGQGMTHGTIGAMLLTDLILGRENPWAEIYDPARKRLGGLPDFAFAKEAINVAAQYADWITPGDVASVDEIERESGAVVRRRLSKIAVYRDEKGTLHQFSAVCTHLGCIVQWNPTAKTWDCPCHGSRYDKLGKVVNGPANSPLSPVEQE